MAPRKTAPAEEAARRLPPSPPAWPDSVPGERLAPELASGQGAPKGLRALGEGQCRDSAELAQLRLLGEVHDALVQHGVQDAGDCEDAADHSTYLDKEVGELLPRLLILHCDRGEIISQVQRGHLLVGDFVGVRCELVDMQRWLVQGSIRRRHYLRVVLEDGTVRISVGVFLLGDNLGHAVQGTDNASPLEVLLDIADVIISPERDVVDPVRYVDVPCLLIE
mmetsp:Transcript_111255/g.346807  ORF Transcript_111255/g.346807 Transcript_111255/m.346807 type:complete len:222 (-) Transcript_111255:596-1261(-)